MTERWYILAVQDRSLHFLGDLVSNPPDEVEAAQKEYLAGLSEEEDAADHLLFDQARVEGLRTMAAGLDGATDRFIGVTDHFEFWVLPQRYDNQASAVRDMANEDDMQMYAAKGAVYSAREVTGWFS